MYIMEQLQQRARTLEVMFNPGSIAILGASDDMSKPGCLVISNLLNGGFAGELHLVNPGHRQVWGRPCHPSLATLPPGRRIDLAIVAVPAAQVIGVLQECVSQGVRAAIVYSSGFSEIGMTGEQLQGQIREIADRSGMRIVGPNCMGIANFIHHLEAYWTFASRLVNPPEASLEVALISQSGGFGASIMEVASQLGIGFSYYISSGNEVDTDFADFLAYLVGQEEVKVICGYMEGVRDGRKLGLALDMANAAGKPVVLFKTGRYQVSARAARSHTGALAGAELVYQGFFRQKGVIRVHSLEEMVATLALFQSHKLIRGKGVAIFADSGGHAVVMADKCTEAGLQIPKLAETTQQELTSLLPPFAATANPVDFTGRQLIRADVLPRAMAIVLKDPAVDVAIYSYLPQSDEKTEESKLQQFLQVAASSAKPVILIILEANPAAFRHIKQLCHHRVPAVLGLDAAVRAIRQVAEYATRPRKRGGGTRIPEGAREKVAAFLTGLPPGVTLGEAETKPLLAAYGIPVTREYRATTAAEAAERATAIGYPVVIKIDSPDILHKTEVDGIRLNLNSPDEVRRAFAEVTAAVRQHRPGARISGVLVQEMLPRGLEVIVGVSRDPTFGSTVMCGVGGVLVEALQDVSLRVVPLGEADAWEMLQELRGKVLLDGWRNQPPADKGAVVDVICRLGQLAADFPQIAELDINPLVVFPDGQGTCAADALIVVQ